MIRRQILINKHHAELLKRLSQTRGVSEAEINRQAIEREAADSPVQATYIDRSAWQALISFLESRQAVTSSHQPYRWNREEIYAERENR
jgi:hypothetical protein